MHRSRFTRLKVTYAKEVALIFDRTRASLPRQRSPHGLVESRIGGGDHGATPKRLGLQARHGEHV